jgi:hypothetical protein
LHDVRKNTRTYKCMNTYTFLTLCTECRVAHMKTKTLHKTPTPIKGRARQLSTNKNCWQAKEICTAKMYCYFEVHVLTLFKNYALFPIATFNNNSYSTTNKTHLFLKWFILVKHSTCFGRSFHPSPGAQDRTYSNRRMSNSCCYLLLSGMRWSCISISSPIASGSSSCMTYAWFCMCGLELLVMDGKTVRNMQSVLQEQIIWETGASCWLYYRNILRCADLWTSSLTITARPLCH